MTLLKEYALIFAGSLIGAVSISLFLAPNQLATGGAGGIGILIYSGFSVPVSYTVTIVNTVLFAFGFKLLSGQAILKTLVSSLSFAIFIEVFSHFKPLTEDVFIASAFGGAVLGIGTALVICSGASTGGSDFAAVLIHQKIKYLSVTKLIFIMDFFIIALSWFTTKNHTTVFYAFLGLFSTIKFMDFTLKGSNFSKLVYIISNENRDICNFVIQNMKRGATFIDARGGYTGDGKQVLLCVVSSRQFPVLKKYVLSKDENAFIILSDARSVFGKGFMMK